MPGTCEKTSRLIRLSTVIQQLFEATNYRLQAVFIGLGIPGLYQAPTSQAFSRQLHQHRSERLVTPPRFVTFGGSQNPVHPAFNPRFEEIRMKRIHATLLIAASLNALQVHSIAGQETAAPARQVETKSEKKERRIRASPGTPKIDGEIDEVWKAARKAKTDRYVESESSVPATEAATAEFRCLWDQKHVYILAVVKDAVLSADADEDWQQDSVEIFIDENMARSTIYDGDDGQYRVNCDGHVSFGQVAKEAITSSVRKTKTGYVVEAAIELTSITAQKGTKIGFDVQVNDDTDGSGTREAIMKWSDDTNETYQDVSRLGTLVFGTARKPKARVDAKVK